MKIGSPKEIFKGENRVAMTPDSAKHLQKLGYECIIESGAGNNSNFSDKDYKEAVERINFNSKELLLRIVKNVTRNMLTVNDDISYHHIITFSIGSNGIF